MPVNCSVLERAKNAIRRECRNPDSRRLGEGCGGHGFARCERQIEGMGGHEFFKKHRETGVDHAVDGFVDQVLAPVRYSFQSLLAAFSPSCELLLKLERY